MAGKNYDLLLTPRARRGLDRLSPAAAAAVAELFLGDLLVSPARVGKPLREDLEGLWSARRGPYRVVYEIEEEPRRVTVHRIDHRSGVYRGRT